jgi:hypothetical protein
MANIVLTCDTLMSTTNLKNKQRIKPKALKAIRCLLFKFVVLIMASIVLQMDVTLTVQIGCLWRELGVTLVLHLKVNYAWHRRILGF